MLAPTRHTETVKSFIMTFKHSAYPNENVRTACTQFKVILKALLAANDIPTQAATTILAGFSTSFDKVFNTICDNLSRHERITPPRRRRPTISTSKRLYNLLVEDILPVLEGYHRDQELAGTWAGLGKPGAYQIVSSAAFVTALALYQYQSYTFTTFRFKIGADISFVFLILCRNREQPCGHDEITNI
eukprot:scaffold11579_cov40-Cyclotella_meneghiniana.AAC.16